MTTVFTASDPAATAADTARARSAATAAAALVPSAGTLEVGDPVDVSAVDPSVWAGAAAADLRGADTGTVAVLVPAALLEVLSNSPMGNLDVGAALQPALDAAAAALGVGGAAGAESMSPVAALERMGPAARAFPLMAADGVGAVVLVDAVSPALAGPAPGAVPAGLEMLHGVLMEVTVELGRTRLPVHELLTLTPGAVIELDRPAGSPVDLLVNGRLIARGEVVVIDEDFGLRVTEIVPTTR